MLLRVFFCILIFGLAPPVLAQGDDFAQRLVLAEKMLEIRPAKGQLENAVSQYVSNYLFNSPEEDQENFRDAVLSVMNPKALEKITVDAYAEIFTLAELESMVEYFAKPEARSASNKQGQLSARIAPQIIEMLDQALIRLRTETQTP